MALLWQHAHDAGGQATVHKRARSNSGSADDAESRSVKRRLDWPADAPHLLRKGSTDHLLRRTESLQLYASPSPLTRSPVEQSTDWGMDVDDETTPHQHLSHGPAQGTQHLRQIAPHLYQDPGSPETLLHGHPHHHGPADAPQQPWPTVRVHSPPSTSMVIDEAPTAPSSPYNSIGSPRSQHASRYTMGFRADCLRCQNREPGHWAHPRGV